MLSFLIDGIHEDLNRVKVKKVTEDPDRTGLTENQIAAKFWENHLARNDSIIVDLMHGQYRSEIECPKCGKVSITFDPFLMLTLPIPEKAVKNVEFVYVDTEQSVRGKVSVMKGSNAGAVKDKVCELLNLDPENIIIADTNMGSLKSIITSSAKVTKRNPLMLYNHAKDPLNENDSQIVFCDFRKKSYGYSGTIVGQPHLLKVPKDITLQDLYLHVFKYVLKLKKEEPEDFETLFKEKFGNFFNKSCLDNTFSLKIHNPYQFPCVICERISCPGCPIPYESKKLSKFSSRCQEPNLRMTLTFGEQYYDTSFIANLKTHDSYNSRNNDNKLNESVEISECFNLFSRKEKLDEFNTSYCSNCKDHVEGIKKMDIFRLPKILIIHFKRFKQKGYFSSKNNKLVEFPIEGLDMQSFCLNGGGIYDLYAVSNHYGSLEGGHYTAYAKSHDGV